MIDTFEIIQAAQNQRSDISEDYFSPFEFGFCVDTKDPENMGRIKVSFISWGDDCISDWIPVARPFAGEDRGVWMLPAVDDMVLCTFIDANPNQPVVIGGLYHNKALPPVGADGNIRLFQTKAGVQIVLDDTEGKEKIILSLKEDKMRLVLDKESGIQAINELGDIEIKCKKCEMSAEDTINFAIKKEMKIEADEASLECKQDMFFKAGGNVEVKGSEIDLKPTAVAAKGKQVAKEGDQVVGVDTHIEMVPSSSGQTPVPFPNPYMGQIDNMMSEDVKLGGMGVATKGTMCSASPGHMITVGTNFQKPPTNKGEITLLCEPTVKVNGKEVAVIGSKVKTCNDPSDLETSQVVTAGMAFGMDGTANSEVKFSFGAGGQANTRDIMAKDGTKGSRESSLSDPKWNKTEASFGDEVNLSVKLSGKYKGATVYFNIFEEGKDPEKDTPVTKIAGYQEEDGESGSANVKWIRHYIHDPENPLTAKPKFFFVADSYLCEPVKSEPAEFGADIMIMCINEDNEGIKDISFKIPGTEKTGKTDAQGKIMEKSVIPGQFVLISMNEDKAV